MDKSNQNVENQLSFHLCSIEIGGRGGGVLACSLGFRALINLSTVGP